MSKRVCVFVDGENLRHSICDLFSNFKNHDYLPKDAEWTKLFDWIATEVVGEKVDRIRTYWYVVKDIDFKPYGLNVMREGSGKFESILCWDENNKKKITAISDPIAKTTLVESLVKEYVEQQGVMEKRFAGWIHIQNAISGKHTAIEFRRAGSILYNLFEKKFGFEKAVDVNLAVDLIRLKDIYDVAVIVSGDQDYVPAVSAIKDFGKRVVSVAFKKEDGSLLPGGARRLGYVTDSTFEVSHEKLKDFLKIQNGLFDNLPNKNFR